MTIFAVTLIFNSNFIEGHFKLYTIYGKIGLGLFIFTIIINFIYSTIQVVKYIKTSNGKTSK